MTALSIRGSVLPEWRTILSIGGERSAGHGDICAAAEMAVSPLNAARIPVTIKKVVGVSGCGDVAQLDRATAS